MTMERGPLKSYLPEGELSGARVTRHIAQSTSLSEMVANPWTHPPRGEYTELRIDGTRWMMDFPVEVSMAQRAVAHFRGHVLMVGLGLGLVPLMARGRMERMTVIERDERVIGLVSPYLELMAGCPVDVVCADFLDVAPIKSDALLVDIWQGNERRTRVQMAKYAEFQEACCGWTGIWHPSRRWEE